MRRPWGLYKKWFIYDDTCFPLVQKGLGDKNRHGINFRARFSLQNRLMTQPKAILSTASSYSVVFTAAQRRFFEEVYEVVKLVPLGRVTTYGAIAHYLGTKGSARMVGWALHQAVHHPDVPAHRVVNRNGLLTGKHHFTGEKSMEQLLTAEGVKIVNDQVCDFEQRLWEPLENEGGIV